MEEELLLISLSNTTVKYFMYNGGEAYKPVGILIEIIKISPLYPLLKLIINYVFVPLKPVLHNLDENVCFLDIAENKEITPFIIGCDWCSICNGIVETAKSNIVKNPKITKSIDFEKLKYADKYLDFCLVDRTEKLTNEKIEEWCKNTFGKKSIDLLLFSQIYLKMEMIELRWCPFKRSKEFYYRNKDRRYLEPTEKTIYEVGKILSKHETITCNNCPKVVNENWKYTKSNKHSIFQPLLDYMIDEIKKS
jgi:hypothetical protein